MALLELSQHKLGMSIAFASAYQVLADENALVLIGDSTAIDG